MADYTFEDLRYLTLTELLEIKKNKMEELARVDKECLTVIGGIMYSQREIHRRKNEILESKLKQNPNTWNCCQIDIPIEDRCPICQDPYED